MKKGGPMAFLFLAPFTLLFAVFLLYPAYYSIDLSFHKATLYTDLYEIFTTMKFSGLDNYRVILADPQVWWALVLSGYYALLLIPLQIGLSLGLATLLTNRLPGVNFFRSAFFLPNILDLYVISVIWCAIYAPKYGALDQILTFLGWAPFPEGVLNHPWWAMVGVAVAVSLKNAGFGMILYLSAIQNIPSSVYEAAEIDGASKWQQLVHITLPLVKPITLILVVTGLLGALSASAEFIAMTNGDPSHHLSESIPFFGGTTQNMTRLSGFLLYEKFYITQDYGSSAALSVILLLVALPISVASFSFFNPDAPTIGDRWRRLRRKASA